MAASDVTGSWVTLSDAATAEAAHLNTNFTELRNLLTSTKLNHENLQYPRSLFCVSYSMYEGADFDPGAKQFTFKLPTGEGTTFHLVSMYVVANSLAGSGTVTATLWRDDSPDVQLAQATCSVVGIPGEDTSFAETSVGEGDRIYFSIDGASGGGDQISFGVWMKGYHTDSA
tara:strand:- start:633 stop:1148 length:516 start_codon:yes stop_codon:yes gene_type:complete